MSAPLVRAAGLDPRNVRVVLIGDPTINAFVAGGQVVYVHSGLILAADDANQVQGVIAHELGHIAGGHVTRFGDGAKAATGISLVSLILGAAAMAAGAGSAGAGIIAAGQQAAQGSFLAFTRVQESSADAAGASYLNAAGITGHGMLDFFRKLENQELRAGIAQTDSFNRSHPLSGERIAFLTSTLQMAPAWNRPSDPKLEARFAEVKAKLAGFLQDPRQTLREYPHNEEHPRRALRARLRVSPARPDRPSARRNEGAARRRAGQPVFPGARRADPAGVPPPGRRGGPAGARHATDRQQPADRAHLRPRAAGDRRSGPPCRGGARAARGGGAGPRQPLRLVAARLDLRGAGRRRARGAGHGGALAAAGPAADRAAQRCARRWPACRRGRPTGSGRRTSRWWPSRRSGIGRADRS